MRIREVLRVQEISRGAIPAARSPGLLSRRVSTKWTASLGPVACKQAGTLDAHFNEELARHVPNCEFEQTAFCKGLKMQ